MKDAAHAAETGACAIRRATEADAEGIAHVHVDSWRETYAGLVPADFLTRLTYERSAERTRQSAAASDWLCWVAEDAAGGGIVGFASGGRQRHAGLDYTGEVYAIYVLESHQRRGLGRRLMAELAGDLRARGFGSLLIWALRDNPSRGFYEALGGSPVAEEVLDIGGARLLAVAYGWRDCSPLLPPPEPR